MRVAPTRSNAKPSTVIGTSEAIIRFGRVAQAAPSRAAAAAYRRQLIGVATQRQLARSRPTLRPLEGAQHVEPSRTANRRCTRTEDALAALGPLQLHRRRA